ncbi:hypothetical protein BDK89_0163 [Ilumatobacter fluminis]|uniref:PD-(D/E)XK nuclease-like domain-containing protein n=1 Tax=Ilumatobacter fluminis TaxID=467091 RepID=A0A4V3EII1_9ACTN|nr:hypothetical protein [Ilumatobacter fluminis]TDT14608.1 hypothetical protein BDK89_0163 [Ilumatobacter fluminis]
MTPSWDSVELTVASDDARTARYRRLQSWYRQNVLGVEAGRYRDRNGVVRPLGSLLPDDRVHERPGLNFLSDEITRYAVDRADIVVGEGGTLEQHRLFHNMLSSMPMCFNIFGAVRSDRALAERFVHDVLGIELSAVELVECEWTPRDPDSSIGDRTAFDAAVVVRSTTGARHLAAVETKYTEPFSRTRYGARDHDAGRYRAVYGSTGWFTPGSYDDLTAPSTNQLWRNCLLAANAVTSGEFDSAEVIVVALEDDPGASKALDGVRRHMLDPDLCRMVSLEHIVERAADLPGLGDWAADLRRRYIELPD